jgi:hypothetical protein
VIKHDDPKPTQSDPLEILEALRDTTNPKRGSLDRNMLARKAAFLRIIKYGTERDFIQALRGFGKGEDTLEGQHLIIAFRKLRGLL